MMLTDQEIDALWSEITLPQKVARREILRKGIKANNAKVLEKLEPVAFKLTLIGGAGGGSGFTRSVEIKGRTVETLNTPPLYSAETVSAIIQDRDSLAARVKELNDLLAKSLVNNMMLKDQL